MAALPGRAGADGGLVDRLRLHAPAPLAADSQKLRELWQKSPQAEQAFRLSSQARTEPNIGAWQDIREVLQNALSAVLAQRATARAALKDAARRANKLIQEKK